MANTTRWIIDTAWTAATFASADLNNLPSGGSALSTAAIANGTNLDQYMDVSFFVIINGTTVAGSYVTIYLLPLNQDGTSYGDTQGSSTTLQPAAGYAVGSIGVRVGASSSVGGIIQGINLPPGDFKLAFGNNLQIPLGATAALTLKYRTYNQNLAV